MSEKHPAIYIVANRRNGTLYTGVTSDLPKRIWEHKNSIAKGFNGRYKCNLLVYHEYFDSMEYAIEREKQIKAGSRKDKLKLIEAFNPNWVDLYENICSW
ncbi:MAG: endonuclease [Rickettsiaceae bacterium]|jgi:putative endonuclease|nr:endonuclease [Rickettsiaceae bacterium]